VAWACGLAVAVLALTAGTAAAAGERVIHVLSNGWHTSIAIPRADLSADLIPEVADFPAASHLEFGWGDAAYYPAAQPTLGLALRAAVPGPAVVHLAGLPAPAAEVFPTATVLAVPLTNQGLAGLIGYLAASFAREGAGKAAPAGPGLYGFSRFYPGTGSFHLFNTCNTWTARALAAAGVPLEVRGVQTAHDLVSRLQPFARGP
jgi:uncharacterized protein (TIGR02117 family)